MVDYAYLILPTRGITIKVKVGEDGCHSTLTKTYHLADNSRGVDNFAMLSFYKKK